MAESIKTLVVMYRMLKYLIFIVLPLVAIGCADSATNTTNTDEEQKSDFVPGQVMVQFVSSVSLDSGQVITESFGLIWLEILSDPIKIVLLGVPVGEEI